MSFARWAKKLDDRALAGTSRLAPKTEAERLQRARRFLPLLVFLAVVLLVLAVVVDVDGFLVPALMTISLAAWCAVISVRGRPGR